MSTKNHWPLGAFALFFLAIIIGTTVHGQEKPYDQRRDVKKFVQYMAKKHQFKQEQLLALFAQVKPKAKVVAYMYPPPRTKQHPHGIVPWYTYKKNYVTAKRIRRGVAFWRNHRNTLNRIATRYQVPAQTILAILGIETLYGLRPGKFKVFDSLAVLAFNHPKRAPYFKRELEEFLLLCRERHLDPLKPLGSYAGAMGQPQFMPHSYRRYAVNFDAKGEIDLDNNVDDIMASIANYLKKHGWRNKQPIVIPASVKGDAYRRLNQSSNKPRYSLYRLQRFGIAPRVKLSRRTKAAFFSLHDGTGNAYWLGLQNFYVITRYNSNKLYAMAVYELGKEIKKAYQNTA